MQTEIENLKILPTKIIFVIFFCGFYLSCNYSLEENKTDQNAVKKIENLVEFNYFTDSTRFVVKEEGDSIYSFNKLEINSNNWSRNISDSLYGEASSVIPSFTIDTSNNVLYFNLFAKKLLGLNIENGQYIYSYTFEPYRRDTFDPNSNVRLKILNKTYKPNITFYDERVYLLSMNNLILFDAKLNLIASYADTLYKVFSNKSLKLNEGYISKLKYNLKESDLVIETTYFEYDIERRTDTILTFKIP